MEPLTPELVAAYLRTNPQFFETQPKLLSDIRFPNPHGDGAISLVERQQIAQRDRIQALEQRLGELLDHAQDNEDTSNKVHRLGLGLLASSGFHVLLQLLAQNLRLEFGIPQTAVRLWAEPSILAPKSDVTFSELPQEVKDWVAQLEKPYCGNKPPAGVMAIFPADNQPQSVAVMPLKLDNVFGLLVIGSDDVSRFTEQVGTRYLKHIGEMVSAAMLRYTER